MPDKATQFDIADFSNYKVKLRVRYSETDMSGYPHHSRYFVWLEEARHAMLRDMGLSYGQMEKEGLYFPIIDAKCRYLQSVLMDDMLTIFPKIILANRRMIKISYQIYKDDVKVAEAETTNIAVNIDRQPISIPQKYLGFLKALQQIQQKQATE